MVIPVVAGRQVREWVIAASLDPTISQQGNLRSCKACQSDTFEANVVCHKCSAESEPCAISGKSDNHCKAPLLCPKQFHHGAP